MILLILLFMGALGTGNAPAALIIAALVIYRYRHPRKPSRRAQSVSSAPPSVIKPLTAAQIERQREKEERQRIKAIKEEDKYNVALFDYDVLREERNNLRNNLLDIQNQIDGARERKEYETEEKLRALYNRKYKEFINVTRKALKAKQLINLYEGT